ncbi:MAG: YncE family protein [Prevotellaceae bacterium]|jgi:hypothetical protein|nr:YncE family protein [Prevotellaceae bacterium]
MNYNVKRTNFARPKICGTIAIIACVLLMSCDKQPNDEQEKVICPGDSSLRGFFLLNEGGLSENNSTLDYFDYASGNYSTDIFSQKNPSVVGGLGSLGNDLQIYGDKLYAAINGSNLVEVMNVNDAKHIKAITVANCRFIAFHGGNAYVSSYMGEVDENDIYRGKIVRIDTASLNITGQCIVGYQPEGIAIRGDKLYVANSGWERKMAGGSYDSTVSVIDLVNFTKIKDINVAINLNFIISDASGKLYVNSFGDFVNVGSDVFVIDANDQVERLDIRADNMTVDDDFLYAYSNAWDIAANASVASYVLYNTKTKSIVPGGFITDGTQLILPNGIAINPETKEIFLADAEDRSNSGKLYCFSHDGKQKWTRRTGVVPRSITFTKN